MYMPLIFCTMRVCMSLYIHTTIHTHTHTPINHILNHTMQPKVPKPRESGASPANSSDCHLGTLDDNMKERQSWDKKVADHIIVSDVVSTFIDDFSGGGASCLAIPRNCDAGNLLYFWSTNQAHLHCLLHGG
jgi:hypothetical protein